MARKAKPKAEPGTAAAWAETLLPAPKKPRRRGKNAEAQIQAAIVAWARLVAPQCVIAAIPNGGLRSKSEAARMKWTGTLAGVLDLFILAPGARVFFMEIKYPGEWLSVDQEIFALNLDALRIPWAVCTSVDDARDAFKAWGIETREVLTPNV